MLNNSREISEDILKGLTSELGKYPLSCLNEHNKIVQNIEKLYIPSISLKYLSNCNFILNWPMKGLPLTHPPLVILLVVISGYISPMN